MDNAKQKSIQSQTKENSTTQIPSIKEKSPPDSKEITSNRSPCAVLQSDVQINVESSKLQSQSVNSSEEQKKADILELDSPFALQSFMDVPEFDVMGVDGIYQEPF